MESVEFLLARSLSGIFVSLRSGFFFRFNRYNLLVMESWSV